VSVLVVVCKRMQQLPTILGPEVYCGKDTSHKTLETTPKTLEELFKKIQHWCATLHSASTITEQKKCWELFAQKVSHALTHQ